MIDENKVTTYSRMLAEYNVADDKKDKEFYDRRTTPERVRQAGFESLEAMEKAELERLTNFNRKHIGNLLAAIENKDFDWLNETLHTGNKISRKIFTLETGVSLGKTNKSTHAALYAWALVGA